MILQIFYRNDQSIDRIFLDVDNDVRVKECIKKLSIEMFISSEYITLKCNNKLLEDEQCFNAAVKDNCKIMMYIKVRICRGCAYENYITLLMTYNDTVEDLSSRYCILMDVSDVKFTLGKDPIGSNLLRNYLTCNNYIFSAFYKVCVNVTNKYNKMYDFVMYENDTIREIRRKLRNENFLDSKKDILMMNNVILLDFRKIYRYGQLNCFSITIGFYITVIREDLTSLSVIVNVDTKVSYLKQYLLNKVDTELNLMSLEYNSKDLENEKTVGLYKILEGCVIHVTINIRLIILYINEGVVIEYVTKKGKSIREIKEELSKKYMVDRSKILLLLYYNEIVEDFIIASFNSEERSNLQMYIDFVSKSPSTILGRNSTTIKNKIGKDTEEKWKESYINHLKKYDQKLCINNKIHLTNTVPSGRTHLSLMVINLSNDASYDCIHRIVVGDFCFVQWLKIIIFCELMLDVRMLDVYYLGEVLNGGSLYQYGIKDNQSIVLKPRNNRIILGEKFTIKIENESQTYLGEFIIDDFDTVQDLKYILQTQYNIDMAIMKLLLEYEELKNDCVIKQLDIGSGCSLTLVVEENCGNASEMY